MPDPGLEPLLDWDDIQGNVVVGFNKDHQHLLGLRFGDDLSATRRLVGVVAAWTTPLRALVAHRVARSLVAGLRGEELLTDEVFLASAFSFDGLRKLSPDAEAFTDRAFREGVAASSSELGDPESPTTWLTGGPGNVPDLLLILASDNAAAAEDAASAWTSMAVDEGAEVIFEQCGHDLPHYTHDGHDLPAGREHFGFKDGISHPGVRGRLPDGSFLEPRASTGPADPTASTPEYTSSGRPLVCAGQFVLGYARQVETFPRYVKRPRPLGGEQGAVAPAWAANGSFLVFRRLRQDVAAFRAFASAGAAAIGQPDIGPARVAAMVTGRWPSGAPLVRTPDRDRAEEAGADVVNAFGFGDANAALGLPADSDGVRCPVVAHIRKVNPRDLNTDIGAASATLTKRILRRGIPYGPPFLPEATEDDGVDRGLLFLSYQESIADQFEFISSRWMNSRTLPTNPGGGEGLGDDMIVGQQAGDSRVRRATLRFPSPAGFTECEITTEGLDVLDWVVPTGGGYFFAPAISSMRDVLGGKTNRE